MLARLIVVWTGDFVVNMRTTANIEIRILDYWESYTAKTQLISIYLGVFIFDFAFLLA